MQQLCLWRRPPLYENGSAQLPLRALYGHHGNTHKWPDEIVGQWPRCNQACIPSNMQKLANRFKLIAKAGSYFSFASISISVLWALFIFSTAVFSTTTLYIAMKKGGTYWLEWIGLALSLNFWAWMGVTAHEEFLVILPLSCSILIGMGHLWGSLSVCDCASERVKNVLPIHQQDLDCKIGHDDEGANWGQMYRRGVWSQ